jgi:glycyl-tRNA synthetase beta chain
MPEFFLELFSEEIPARMQRYAAGQLEKICTAALQTLGINAVKTFYGPRRIALSAVLASETSAKTIEERGPRETAPEAALKGFLGKHGASRDDVVVEGGYFVLRRAVESVPATAFVLQELPEALAKFSWPKSMRWGQGGDFTWVRPLRRVVCLLGGEVVPITVGPITASNETQGHRVLGADSFFVSSAADWEKKLRTNYVVVDQVRRKHIICEDLNYKINALGLSLVEDDGLLDEVTGLVEWPRIMIGRIDKKFMDLPAEVRELSMKVNQKYFAVRNSENKSMPFFAFVANLSTPDDGAAIIAGNERVLRARLSDACHFWDIDLKTPLNELLPKLDKITFHAHIGSQRTRADRIANLAQEIASHLTHDENQRNLARLAGLYCKADLVTGMVGEFPELQGIMGGYYAERMHSGSNNITLGQAIRTHYQPKGPTDQVPHGIVAISVALADKLDTLIQFFRIGEIPTGSSDPYALRRAALGVIRIILENDLNLQLDDYVIQRDLFVFIIERLKVKLRGEGRRPDVLDAVLKAGTSDNLSIIMKRVSAVSDFLATPDGTNLLVAYRRAANILRIESTVEGPNLSRPVDRDLLDAPEEVELAATLNVVAHDSVDNFYKRNFGAAMEGFAKLRAPVDAFFDKVTVNAPEPELRLNRLRLLAQLRDTMHQIADFSKIVG